MKSKFTHPLMILNNPTCISSSLSRLCSVLLTWVVCRRRWQKLKMIFAYGDLAHWQHACGSCSSPSSATNDTGSIKMWQYRTIVYYYFPRTFDLYTTQPCRVKKGNHFKILMEIEGLPPTEIYPKVFLGLFLLIFCSLAMGHSHSLRRIGKS